MNPFPLTRRGFVGGVAAAAVSRVTPYGARGDFRLVADYTFGNASEDSTIHSMADLQKHFFFRYIYDQGRLDRLPYEWARHTVYPQDDPRSLHVFSSDALILKGRIPSGGGLFPGGLEAGMLRAAIPLRPGQFIEASVKLPRGVGLLPAFWLAAGAEYNDHTYTALPWPPEIDIFEFLEFTQRPRPTVMTGHIQVNGHPERYGPPHDISSKFVDDNYSPGVDFSAAYHTFALDWVVDRPIWLVDGEQVKQTYYQWGPLPAHVMIGNQIGLTMPGVDVAGMNPDQSDWDFGIKYLRVWQRLGAAT